ncbi:hypothetical protein EVAR_66977_1 [Eumeta japonica]|uniref:Uncharacterized protein n=1 Tax=Eumeta variegata TaxID=151549 RepID=A0A4C1ZTN9_EUMVA|nr:hypothetical protein EVAR_66977_1 [Eumeta japonica]
MLQRVNSGSGPRRTPRRGAAGPDASSQGHPRFPASANNIANTSGNYAVGVALDAHGDNADRRACVCAAEHACRAPRYAPRPDRPAYFVTTLNLLRSRTYTPPHQS